MQKIMTALRLDEDIKEVLAEKARIERKSLSAVIKEYIISGMRHDIMIRRDKDKYFYRG